MNDYPEVGVNPTSTSYFSDHAEGLDPELFDSAGEMHPDVRGALYGSVMDYLNLKFIGPVRWARAWVAGSAVSFQWEASRSPGDLDVLVGIDFTTFRELNRHFSGMSDGEIAKTINEGFRESLYTENWNGFEVTYYVNPDSWDIRAINPYAAVDLSDGAWAVEPSRQAPPENTYWKDVADRDKGRANKIAGAYTKAVDQLRNATNPAYRINAEAQLKNAVSMASDLYNEIHMGRKGSFSRTGEGYAGWGNYRWQAGKSSGVIPAMRALHEYQDQVVKSGQVQTYGIELPDAATMIRRAAAQRAQTKK